MADPATGYQADEAAPISHPFIVEDDANPLTVVDDSVPKEKSDVEIDGNAPAALRRFRKGDRVHMTVIDSTGRKRKGSFTIIDSQANPHRAFWEYQLENDDGFSDGKWYREKELKLEQRAK